MNSDPEIQGMSDPAVLDAFLMGFDKGGSYQAMIAPKNPTRLRTRLRLVTKLGWIRRTKPASADVRQLVLAILEDDDICDQACNECMRRAGSRPFLDWLKDIDWVALIQLLLPIILSLLKDKPSELYMQGLPSHSLDAPRISDIPTDAIPINPEDLTAEGQP